MRCLLGLQWDDDDKMCVTDSRTCRDDHVTDDHVTHDHVTADHVPSNLAHFDATWLEANRVFHRRQPSTSDDEDRRHQLRHFHQNDVIY